MRVDPKLFECFATCICFRLLEVSIRVIRLYSCIQLEPRISALIPVHCPRSSCSKIAQVVGKCEHEILL